MELLALALWFGLATGLVEAAEILVARQFRWTYWESTFHGHSLEIVWICTLFDLLLFGVLGLATGAAARYARGSLPARTCLWGAIFLATFDWLIPVLFSHVRGWAIAILAAGLATSTYQCISRYQPALLRFCRRRVRWIGAAALLLVIAIQSGLWLDERVAAAKLPAASPGMPNVLFIVVDTRRADHLSCYGYSRCTSPALDGIARQGVLFENAISPSSWTQPAHASLLTGRYPHEHQAETAPLDNRFPTLGEAMCERGYRTGAFSANPQFFTRVQGFGRGFLRFEDRYHSAAAMAKCTVYGRLFSAYGLPRLGFVDDPTRKRAADVNRALFRWLDQDRTRPCFAFLNYFDVHEPFLPPEPFRSRFSKPGDAVPSAESLSGASVRERQSVTDAYDNCVAYVDQYLSELFRGLQERGMAANSVVVVTSDHGELLGEHGLRSHGNALYRELVHVPLLIWWPGHLPAGVRVAQPASTKALAATLMDIVGSEGDAPFPGPSLTCLWRDPGASDRYPHPVSELGYFPRHPIEFPSHYGAAKSLVTPKWHLIVHDKLGAELYDWKDDPRESRNLAAGADGQRLGAELIEMSSRDSAVSPVLR